MIDRATKIQKAVTALRRAVSEGLKALKNSNRRWTNERVAEELELGASKTVQRWENRENTIRRSACEKLDAQWPEFFPNVMALLGDLERSKSVDRTPPTIELAESIAETYRDVVGALEADPTDAELRIIRHCAFHGDLGDERQHEGGVPADLAPLLQRFGEAMTSRIVEGWHVRTMFTVGTDVRLDDRVTGVADLDGPSLEVRAFIAGSVPLVAPLIIGDTAFVATDHQRWNRAEAALRFEGNTSILLWLHRYFDMLWDRAPYRLRTISGPQEAEFERLRRDLHAFLDIQERLQSRS